ncbi:MAG: cyclodeaminase/cyclohydrolase family protein [Anaerolineae bacterium]
MEIEKEVTSTATGDWLRDLASPQVSPGAGSAAAIAGAMGVALLIKLARLSQPQEIAGHRRLLDRLLAARERLWELAEADASALRACMCARRSAPGAQACQSALETLVQIPLQAAELCRTIALEAQPLLERGYSCALPDGRAGIQLLAACQRALCILIRTNLPLLED